MVVHLDTVRSCLKVNVIGQVQGYRRKTSAQELVSNPVGRQLPQLGSIVLCKMHHIYTINYQMQ